MVKYRTARLLLWALLCVSFGVTGCLKFRSTAEPPPKYMNTKDTFETVEVEQSVEPMGTFVLDGKPYCFGGTNIYYLQNKSRFMVDDALDKAKAHDMDVVRIWGYVNIGSLDGSVPAIDNVWDPLGKKDDVYFQYWDPETNQAVLNEGEDGLPRLDYVLHAARERGLKLIIVLINNWVEFGGVDQYVIWHGLKHHHEFYTHEAPRQTFKNYIKALVMRKNTVDGTLYRDDPAIFAWELANEPRCLNGGEFDSLEGWDGNTLVNWVAEMSGYIKELDSNHIVGIGDEGFLKLGINHWTYNGHEGVDHEAMTAVDTIDFATFHLYPDDWGTGYKHGYDWIRHHIDVARRLGKPTILEEYSAMVRRDEKTQEVIWGWERRKTALTNWQNLMFELGGNGIIYWMLAGVEDNGKNYPDYDHYTIYPGEPSTELVHSAVKKFKNEAPACKVAEQWIGEIPKSPFVGVVHLKKE